VKIYTRTGDSGESGLIGGERRPKDDLVFEALGHIDELNAAIGLARSGKVEFSREGVMEKLQSVLFDLGAEVATPQDSQYFKPAEIGPWIERLEKDIDAMDQLLEPLRNFILPGGTELASRLHAARCICRRAERSLVRLSANQELRADVLGFVNRLSDWLFAAARLANLEAQTPDVIWRSERG
jgi:cob(I)alamin adenosyltransferase